MIRAAVVLLALVLAGCTSARGPLTRAEASGYTETSRGTDVSSFLDALAGLPNGAGLHRSSFGRSAEGRDLPLVVWGAPDASPEAIRATGKTRVLVVAGIHAGEVAGKEALLEILRSLALGRAGPWADSLVVIAAPLYNADGAERIAFDHRPLQLGPTAGMGTRATAQNLDLNRDHTKLALPEARALTRLLTEVDPHVVLDLHTTNGTAMGYALTYAPGLHPDTPAPVSALLVDRWLPDVTARLSAEGIETFHYGNVPGAFGEPATAPRGWYSFSAQPRFLTNVVGLRGRVGVLLEAYSYAPYETRIRASRRMTEELLAEAAAAGPALRALLASTDAAPFAGRDAAVRTTFAALDRPAEILLGAVDTVAHPVTGLPMRRDTGERRRETMPAFVRFTAAETTPAPALYAVTFGPGQAEVRALLDAHGIAYELGVLWGRPREGFRLDSLRIAERPFQGVRMQEAFGRWEPVSPETGDPPRLAASLLVPVEGPLAPLIVALLDPRSDDGVVAWGVLPPEAFAPGELAPVQRVLATK